MVEQKLKTKHLTSNAPAFLATFPVLPPSPESLEFQVYDKMGDGNFGKKRRLVVAERGKMEYVGVPPEESFCRYAVGIVNKKSGEIELHEATSITIENVVKALKTSESKTIGDKNMEARNQLGQAFGTKKRRQAIKAYEMNQINVGGLADVANKINDTISEHVAKLPEKQTADELSMADRAITPSEVYNIDDILPPSLFTAIDIKALWKARLLQDVYNELAPLNIGGFVKSKIEEILMVKTDKIALKRVLFLAYLMRFYTLKESQACNENVGIRFLNGCSPVISEHLQSFFLEIKGEGEDTKYMLTGKGKDKILSYIICLCLIINNYMVDVTQLSSDLKIGLNAVGSAAKELGCRVEVKKGEKGSGRKAQLVIPLTFPKKSRGAQ
ncbi:DNA-directed RNA polymerase I subunit rpa49 [Boothiomyces sp. JEL0866]|nr:DNA-directed RNA polymerase I subunit rpa49 [Boothiomyces sp. JEL0866]